MPVQDQEPATNQNGQQPEQPDAKKDQQNQPQNGKQDSVKPEVKQDDAKQDDAKQADKQDKDKKDDAEKKPLDPATKLKRILIGIVISTRSPPASLER